MSRDEIRFRIPSGPHQWAQAMEIARELDRRIREEQESTSPALEPDDHVVIEHEE